MGHAKNEAWNFSWITAMKIPERSASTSISPSDKISAGGKDSQDEQSFSIPDLYTIPQVNKATVLTT